MSKKELIAWRWARKYQSSFPCVDAEKDDLTFQQEARVAADVLAELVKPQTMADVGWSREKHALAGAIINLGSGPAEVVMMSQGYDDSIDFALLDGRIGNQPKGRFTPNGKRYKLVEGTTPDHPEVLTTVEDYENAPEGTVVAYRNGRGVDLKYDGNDWRYTGFAQSDSDIDMCGTTRQVLRWGWGDEA